MAIKGTSDDPRYMDVISIKSYITVVYNQCGSVSDRDIINSTTVIDFMSENELKFQFNVL